MKTAYSILVLSHGSIAKELCNTAVDIMGKQDNLEYYCIDRSKPAEQIRKELAIILNDMLSVSSVLVLTDMLGGTPTNMTFPYLERSELEVITGVNLPMLVAALGSCRTADSINDLAAAVEKKSLENIVNLKQRMQNT